MIKELSRLAINTGMSTLSNVNSREGGLNPFGDGLESSVISEVRRLSCREVVEDGVSSDYVQKDDCQWFVLRATYNRVEQDFDTLKASVIYAYLPKRIALKQIGVNPANYSWHSFRRVGASRASERGVQDSVIKKHGRWNSEAYQRYVLIDAMRAGKEITISLTE